MFSSRSFLSLVFILSFIWIVSHIPLLLYGVGDIPIHASYGADEQAPINGALHILEERSFLALRGAHVTQYGPLMSVLALPAAGVDFIKHIVVSGVFSPDSYKTSLLWNWTGILLNARLIALAASLLALIAVYRIVTLVIPESNQQRWLGIIGVLLFATNFHFFEYASYYRHWIFVIAALLWQVYFLEKIRQKDDNDIWLWITSGLLTVTMFGISYFGIFFQILWLPIVWQWWRSDHWNKLVKFVYYTATVAVGCALIVAWVPGPFYRAIGIGYGDISKQGVGEQINEYYGTDLSFSYYLEVVSSNNIALILSLLIVLAVLWRRRELSNSPILVGISLAATTYFIFFSVQSHHEPRYILPAIILILLASAIALAKYVQTNPRRDFWSVVIVSLLLFQTVFHLTHISRLIYLSVSGPAEQRLIEKLLPVVKANPDLKLLVLQDNLLGYPHTKLAYKNYADRYNFSNLGLFKTLQNDSHYTDNKFRLDASYFSVFHLPYGELPDFSQFDLLVTHFRLNEPDVPNDRDACGVNIVRYWWPTLCFTQFDIVPVNMKYESTF